MEWISENKDLLFAAFIALWGLAQIVVKWGLAQIVVKLTPTKKDDEVLAKISPLGDLLRGVDLDRVLAALDAFKADDASMSDEPTRDLRPSTSPAPSEPPDMGRGGNSAAGAAGLVLLLVLPWLTACPGTMAPVDTSQTILVEVAEGVNVADGIVARQYARAADAAMEDAEGQVEQAALALRQCTEQALAECPAIPDGFALYREAMQPWDALVASLEALAGARPCDDFNDSDGDGLPDAVDSDGDGQDDRGLLCIWQQANDIWRSNDDRPAWWNEQVCSPVGAAVRTLLDLLASVGHQLPDGVAAVMRRADDLCGLGLAIADAVSGGDD